MQPMDRRTARLFIKPGMVVYDIGTFDGATAASRIARVQQELSMTVTIWDTNTLAPSPRDARSPAGPRLLATHPRNRSTAIRCRWSA
jgi:hypothetical protein